MGIDRGTVLGRLKEKHPGMEWRVKKHHLQKEIMRQQEAKVGRGEGP